MVSAVAGKNGLEPCRSIAASAATAKVSCVVTTAPDGVTFVGLKEQLPPAGSQLHSKLTAELNPFCGVTATAIDPCAPELTVSEFGEALRVKSSGNL